jgi:hypothetical protein
MYAPPMSQAVQMGFALARDIPHDFDPLRQYRRSGNGAAYEAAVTAFISGADRASRFDLLEQQHIPRRRDGKMYIADVELVDRKHPNVRGLISCKYQRTAGTAEEKLYAEADHLAHVLRANGQTYRKVWLSVAGCGWSANFHEHLASFISDAYPAEAERIVIVNTDELLSVDFDKEIR